MPSFFSLIAQRARTGGPSRGPKVPGAPERLRRKPARTHTSPPDVTFVCVAVAMIGESDVLTPGDDDFLLSPNVVLSGSRVITKTEDVV